MGNKLIGVIVLALAACGGDPPSCQDAMTSFYGAGCALFDGSPPVQVPLTQAVSECKQLLAVVPDRCQAEFDDLMFCFDGVSSDSQCGDCSQEQDALIACD